MKKYVAEALGTFALVFRGTGAIVFDQQTNGAVTHVGIATMGLTIWISIAIIMKVTVRSGQHFFKTPISLTPATP